MARKRRLRFGLAIVFAGRPSVVGVGLGYQPIRFAAAARFGVLGTCRALMSVRRYRQVSFKAAGMATVG